MDSKRTHRVTHTIVPIQIQQAKVHKQTHKELHKADLPVVIADHVLEGQEATSICANGNAS